MDNDMLIEKFARVGARAVITPPQRHLWWQRTGALSIDIGQDRRGEFFNLTAAPDRLERVDVTDVRPRERHLLLQVDHRDSTEGRQKFLCGHDERHWFVAAVPEAARASNVRTAMQALKPNAVNDAEARVGLKARDGRRRKNRAFVRQGEWFFIPRPDANIDPRLILRNEPLSRGAGSKPHWVDELVRHGGETVYVSRQHPTGLTGDKYRDWMRRNPDQARRERFQVMRRNPKLLVRGKVRHPDHKTIRLNGWCEVVMNTEPEARAMRHVAFLD